MAQSRTLIDVSEVVISLVTIQDDDFPLPVMAVCFDQRGKHNIMSKSFFYCLGYALDIVHRFTNEERISAVVFCSGKSSFCVGADIEYQLEINSADLCAETLLSCQELLNLVEAVTVPTVAVINGLALGGGLELCLACDYRVADWQHGRVGLPEVHVGVLPALGGCVRLPRLIGFKPALKLILTGRTIRATEAQTLGLVDALLNASHSKEDGRLVYQWIVELSQQWRQGKMGGQSICLSAGSTEKGAKISQKPAGKLASSSSSGKGTARARMMRANQPAADKAPQRRIAYRVGHLQHQVVDIKDVQIMNNHNYIDGILATLDTKVKQKYPSRWSCWTHVEQMAVYYGALRLINKESHGIFPAPYLCLVAMLRGWQASSMIDACALTIEPYTALALSPESASLMASFLDVRRCSHRTPLFRLPQPEPEQQAVSQSQQHKLSLPTASSARQAEDSNSASAHSDASDSSVAAGDQTVRKRKKKKKGASDGQQEQQNASNDHRGLTPPPMKVSNSSENDSRPASAGSDRSVSSQNGPVSTVKESLEQVITFIGDTSPRSMALLLQLLVAEVPIFLLAPSEVIAHAVLSRVRLQMNQQLKYGSLTPAMKVARLSNLKAGGSVGEWERWMAACCKDLHKIFWDQKPGSTTNIAHLVLVTSTIDSDTYTLDELVNICDCVTVTRAHQSVLLRSCCVLSSPTSYVPVLSQRLAGPSAVLLLQGFGVDSAKIRCLEISSFVASSGKSGTVPETDPWYVRSLAALINKIGKTPVITTVPRGPSFSTQVTLICLEVACRLAVYGGRDLYDANSLFTSCGFQISPLHVLSKVGVSSFVRLSRDQSRYHALHSVLDAAIKAAGDKLHVEDDMKVFNVKGNGVSSYLASAVKQCRKHLTPGKPALVKELRSWSADKRAFSCILACVSEAVRFMDRVEEVPHIDLLLAGGLPCFPICQGGPLFYGDRLGWEEVAEKTTTLLRQGLFSDIPESVQWPLAGEQISKRVAKHYRPALHDGSVVQTLFPTRPQGLPISRGLRGLTKGFNKMPWFSSFEAPIWFCLYLMLFFFICLLVVIWLEVRANGGRNITLPWI